MRIFILSRGYPTDTKLYSYPFVRDRAQAYLRAGHQVMVAVPQLGGQAAHAMQGGIAVVTGPDADCLAALAGFAPDCVAAHAITDDYWPFLSALPAGLPVIGWIHGSEIEDLSQYQLTADSRARAAATHARRRAFWRGLATDWPAWLHLVFVSQTAQDAAFAALDTRFDAADCSVIHNPVDTAFFVGREKPDAQRFDILGIRPYDNLCRATDLTLQALLTLAQHPLWPRFRVTLAGDGPLFDDHTAPLRAHGNVTLLRGFLTRDGIRAQHDAHGIFLIPTRRDTQGLSRDEAMSSGLVPVTNRVAAIPEFTDDSCAVLAPAEDAAGLAAGILDMAVDPQLFQARSRAAIVRVRRQSAMDRIIAQELALMDRLRRGS